MEKKRIFAFDRTNFILLGVGMLIVAIGMILMSGGGSDATSFNPEIFSTLRIKVAPSVCLFGYIFMIYGVLHRPQRGDADAKTKK